MRNTNLQYTSTIRDFPLMFLEMKRTAILLSEGKIADDIFQMSTQQNIYQLEKEKRRRSLPLKMTKRLSTIKKPLLDVLACGPTEEAKLVALLALIKAERIMFEYMLDVYKDKSDDDGITDLDFMQFADRLAVNSDTVAKWKAETLKEINTRIKRILCDAGLAKKTKTGLVVQKPIIDRDFYKLLDEEDWIYARTFLREGNLL